MAKINAFQHKSTTRKLKKIADEYPPQIGPRAGATTHSIQHYPLAAQAPVIGTISTTVTPVNKLSGQAGFGKAYIWRVKPGFTLDLMKPIDYRDATSGPVQEIDVFNYQDTTFTADVSPGSITPATQFYLFVEDAYGQHWIVSATGSTSTTEFYWFELQEDLTIDGNHWAKAQLLDKNGMPLWLDEEETEPWIVLVQDPYVVRMFAGLGRTEDYYGYGGLCRVTDRVGTDIGASGDDASLNVYRIVVMEQQARWLEGTLAEIWEPGTTFGRVEVNDYWGAPFNNREPVTEEHNFGSGTTEDPDDFRDVVKVYDNMSLLSRTLAIGEKVRAVWDEKRKKYYLVSSPAPYIRIKGPSPGVTYSNPSFVLNTYTVINGASISGPITVECVVPMNAPSGRDVYAQFNSSAGPGDDINKMWDNGDGANFIYHLRGLEHGYTGQMLVESRDSDADPHWAETGPCDPPA
jgi:hypothetical protein